MEHNGWTFKPDGTVKSAFGERTDLLSSVAFWYQQGIAQGLPEPPYGARAPQGNAGRSRSKGHPRGPGREGQGLVTRRSSSGPRTCSLRGGGPRAGSRSRSTSRRRRLRALRPAGPGSDYGIYTVLLDGKRRSLRPSSTSRGPTSSPRPVRRLRPRDLRGPRLPGRLAAPPGPPHAHLRVLGKRAASSGLHLGRRRHHPRPHRPAAWAEAAKVKPPDVPWAAWPTWPGPLGLPIPSFAASPP